MARYAACFALASLLSVAVACGGDDDKADDDDDVTAPDAAGETGPFDAVPLVQDLHFPGIAGRIDVVRDQYGIAHIRATTLGDLAFAQGYVTAHDRLPQMDILRRFGAGRVGELFGALNAGAVSTDLMMRAHRMKPLAEEAWAQLTASDDPIDRDLVVELQRFADGVNAYNADVLAGRYNLDEAVLVSFDPERFVAWTPVDCLVLTRFQAFAVSYTAPLEVDITDIYQGAVDVFDHANPDKEPALAARAGASADLLRIQPVDTTSTIDGFPNVDVDTGSRSDGNAGQKPGLRHGARRPRVPRALLRSAHDALAKQMPLGPQAFMVPRAGSNNWAIGPSLAGGKTLLAGDPHQPTPNPSVFYPIHLTVPGEIDAEGITFPGIPGIILGRSANLVWAGTVVFHDVNDVYLENIVPCAEGDGDCALFDGGEVPLETWTEEVGIGVLGTITETKTVTYEAVPHHGPIIPKVDGRDIIPRTEPQALSVRYTGYDVSDELRAGYKLIRAQSVEEAFAAFEDFHYGGQNWVFASADGHIGWTTHTAVPLRSPASYTWNVFTNPDGLAPFLVLPGDGSAEWEGTMDARYLPHSIDPAKGYLVTANADPVGSTFDDDGLNQPMVDGRPLYVGALYDVGLRVGRITRLLEGLIAAGQPMTIDDMADIQLDTRSNYGARMQPFLVAAGAAIDDHSRPEVDAWLATLPEARVTRLREAAGRLAGWTLATPPAVEGDPTADEIADSVATSIFNAWIVHFLRVAVGDEYARIGWDVGAINDAISVRTALALFEQPEALGSGISAATGEPILCDSLDTEEITESCTLDVLQALDQALAWLSSNDGLASTDMTDWRWGKLHRLTMKPLFPIDDLDVPPSDDPNPLWRNGAPNAGDNFAVARADCTYTDLDFTQTEDGAAWRVLAEGDGGTLKLEMALPGGTIYDRSSPHYRDLFDDYYMRGLYFDLPYVIEEIVAAGEERWLLRGE